MMPSSQSCFWHSGLKISVAEDCLAELMGWKMMSWAGFLVSDILAPLNQTDLSVVSSHYYPLFHKMQKTTSLSAEQTVGAGRCLSWYSQHWLPVASYTVCVSALAGRTSAVRWSLKGFYSLIYLSEALEDRLLQNQNVSITSSVGRNENLERMQPIPIWSSIYGHS